MESWADLLAGLEQRDKASQEAMSRWRGTLPSDYLSLVETHNGAEGRIGGLYLRLYPLEEVGRINEIYQVAALCPGLVTIGSNGWGDVFAVDLESTPAVFLRVPFIPLDREYSDQKSRDFEQFLGNLLTEANDDPDWASPGPEAPGVELQYKTPLVFGGDPNDPENLVAVPIEAHAEMCVFWNGVFQRQRSELRGDA